MKIAIIILIGIIIILSVLLFITYRKLVNFRKIKIVIKDDLTSLDSFKCRLTIKGCKTCRLSLKYSPLCLDCDAVNGNFTEWKPKIGIDN